MKVPTIIVPRPAGFSHVNLPVAEANLRPAAGSLIEPASFEEWPTLGALNATETGVVQALRLNRRMSPYLRDNGSSYVAPAVVTGPNGFSGYAQPVNSGIASVVVTAGGSGGVPGNYRKNLTGGGGSGALVVYTVGGGGNITVVSVLERGKGYTGAPTLDTSESGVTGATFTFRRFKTVGSIPVTTAGTGGTRMPTVTVTIGGVTDGTTTTQPRAFAVPNGSGGVARIDFEDSGEFSEMATVTPTFSGGNVTGLVLGAAVTKYNALRGIVPTVPGGQHSAASDIALTITAAAGDGGSGAVGGFLTGRDWTRNSDGSITTPGPSIAGDAYDMNGIMLPFLDDREFTVVAVVKYELVAQILAGSWVGSPANGAAWGGSQIANTAAGVYSVRDPVTGVTVNMALPAGIAANDWTTLTLAFSPAAGVFNSGVQQGDLYARLGLATANFVRGAASAVNLPRLHALGPAYGRSATQLSPTSFRAVHCFKRRLPEDRITAIIGRIVQRYAAMGITLKV